MVGRKPDFADRHVLVGNADAGPVGVQRRVELVGFRQRAEQGLGRCATVGGERRRRRAAQRQELFWLPTTHSTLIRFRWSRATDSRSVCGSSAGAAAPWFSANFTLLDFALNRRERSRTAKHHGFDGSCKSQAVRIRMQVYVQIPVVALAAALKARRPVATPLDFR